MFSFSKLTALALVCITGAASTVLPRDINAPFYLVATTSTGTVLGGVRQSGSTALLSGTNPLAKFYTESPSSLLVQPASSTTGVPNPRSYIDFPYPSCGPGGNLVLVTGSTTNKCAASQPFAFSGSGGSLSFGAQGGFYVCGMDQHVYYQKSTATTPSGCTPTFLFPLNP